MAYVRDYTGDYLLCNPKYKVNSFGCTKRNGYTASVRLYWDMDLLGLSCGDLLGGWDSGDTLLTLNFVVPSLCQLNSTSTVDFGNINDIGTTKRDYTAQRTVMLPATMEHLIAFI